MNQKFLLSRQADRALEEIWDHYFKLGGTRLADRILADIRDAIDRIIEHPNWGHFRPDLTDRPLRFYLVHRFFLVYDPATTPLCIVRVYHSSQDVQARIETDE